MRTDLHGVQALEGFGFLMEDIFALKRIKQQSKTSAAVQLTKNYSSIYIRREKSGFILCSGGLFISLHMNIQCYK